MMRAPGGENTMYKQHCSLWWLMLTLNHLLQYRAGRCPDTPDLKMQFWLQDTSLDDSSCV